MASFVFNSLLRLTARKSSKFHITGPMWGGSLPVTDRFHSQSASDTLACHDAVMSYGDLYKPINQHQWPYILMSSWSKSFSNSQLPIIYTDCAKCFCLGHPMATSACSMQYCTFMSIISTCTFSFFLRPVANVSKTIKWFFSYTYNSMISLTPHDCIAILT